MNSKICPCKDCTTETGRHIGCHADCRAYMQWAGMEREQHDKAFQQRMAARQVNDDRIYRINRMRSGIHR